MAKRYRSVISANVVCGRELRGCPASGSSHTPPTDTRCSRERVALCCATLQIASRQHVARDRQVSPNSLGSRSQHGEAPSALSLRCRCMQEERAGKLDVATEREIRIVASSGAPIQERKRSVSPAYRRTLDRLERFARFDRVAILIEGESGTGKSVLARHVHAMSPRAQNAFVDVDLGALDEALVNSELFGHAQGSFTGAAASRAGLVLSANRGTLFLDEIGKASLLVQQRLLALLERRVVRPVGSDRELPIDVRFVAASNVPLEQLVEQGKMLPDLLPRLSAFRVRLPPLRERGEDVRWLAEDCIARHAQYFGFRHGRPVLEDALVVAMERVRWPHNVRELDNVIQRLLVAAAGDPIITLDHCSDEDLLFLRHAAFASADDLPLTPARAADVFRQTGSISEAARVLGVARSTLHRHLRRFPELGSPVPVSGE